MLQLLVCSDVHTYADNIGLAIDRLDRVDAVLIAGDLETEIDRIREYTGSLPLYAVCGNNDYFLDTDYPQELLIDISDHGPAQKTEAPSPSFYPSIVDIRELSYNTVPEKLTSVPQILSRFAPAAVLEKFCQDKKPAEISHRILLTHGNIYNVPDTGRLARRASLWDADIVIFGHTHDFTDYDQKDKNIRFLNPGCLLGDPASTIRRFAGYEICSFALLRIGFGGEISFTRMRL